MLQDDSDRTPVSLWRVALYFLRLGAIGFGGPIALVGLMQQDLVERRRWVTTKEYLEGLTLSQLAPGPLAAQLAMYLGYIRGGIPGASIVGALFILPSFLLVGAISRAYEARNRRDAADAEGTSRPSTQESRERHDRAAGTFGAAAPEPPEDLDTKLINCARKRPFPSHPVRRCSPKTLRDPPRSVTVASGLSASGPRYRGSNPCLPASLRSPSASFG
jgi:hypothetical protein